MLYVKNGCQRNLVSCLVRVRSTMQSSLHPPCQYGQQRFSVFINLLKWIQTDTKFKSLGNYFVICLWCRKLFGNKTIDGENNGVMVDTIMEVADVKNRNSRDKQQTAQLWARVLLRVINLRGKKQSCRCRALLLGQNVQRAQHQRQELQSCW